MSDSLIVRAFSRTVSECGSRTAIFGLGGLGSRTFSQMRADADEVHAALSALPLGHSPCFVAAIGNHLSFFALLIAALELRARIALFDSIDRWDAIDETARRLGADAIVLRGASAQPPAADRRVVHSLPLGLRAIVRANAGALAREDSAEGPRILKITSGSTGAPRAVVATEANMIADARQIAEAMQIRPGDVSLASIPLSHSYGLGNLVMPLLTQGCPIALRDGFAPRALADDVRSAGVTVLPGVPYQYDHLLRHGLTRAVAAVRLLISAGAPIGRRTLDEFAAASGRPIHSFYGTTETGGISFDADPGAAGDRVTVGTPLPGVEVALEGEPDAGPAGRVVVRSPAVALGYAWNDETDDPDGPAFAGGAFRTGDLAERGGDGRICLVGRVSRFINVAGRKVDPAEVERVLAECPHVLEAVVIGVSDDQRGESIAACVSGDAELASADVRAFCAARLPAHKVPRVIRVVEQFPNDARGKLDRRALESLLCP
jgi:long-chain acyl-CoA synthetase